MPYFEVYTPENWYRMELRTGAAGLMREIMKKEEFTGDTTLAKVLEFSEAEKILMKYNVPCLSCPMAKMEMESLTLAQVSGMYGLELDKILKELNEAFKVYMKN